MTSLEYVVLVDASDKEQGQIEKMEAHRKGLLHRAFSVFIFRKDKDGQTELLLQQRHPSKYHCGGLWTNTCCSHPRPGESILDAGHRRLQEELGFDTKLQLLGSFVYKAEFDSGLIEHELDHVIVGEVDFSITPTIIPSSREVSQVRWVTLSNLHLELQDSPAMFTPWFGSALQIALR